MYDNRHFVKLTDLNRGKTAPYRAPLNAQSDQVVAALRWPSEIDHNIVTVGAGTLGYGCEITDPAGLPAVAMMTG